MTVGIGVRIVRILFFMSGKRFVSRATAGVVTQRPGHVPSLSAARPPRSIALLASGAARATVWEIDAPHVAAARAFDPCDHGIRALQLVADALREIVHEVLEHDAR